jgi:hypothetical protein
LAASTSTRWRDISHEELALEPHGVALVADVARPGYDARAQAPELIANAPGDEITLKKADNHWAESKSGKVTYRKLPVC